MCFLNELSNHMPQLSLPSLFKQSTESGAANRYLTGEEIIECIIGSVNAVLVSLQQTAVSRQDRTRNLNTD